MELQNIAQYKAQITKLSELLRYYNIIKKSNKDSALKSSIKAKCTQILHQLQKYPNYASIEPVLTAQIHKTFQEAKPKPMPTKVIKQEPPKIINQLKRQSISSIDSRSQSSSNSIRHDPISNSQTSIPSNQPQPQKNVITPTPNSPIKPITIQQPSKNTPNQKIITPQQSPKNQIGRKKFASEFSFESEIHVKKQLNCSLDESIVSSVSSSKSDLHNNVVVKQQKKKREEIKVERKVILESDEQDFFIKKIEDREFKKQQLQAEEYKSDVSYKLSENRQQENMSLGIASFFELNRHKLNTQLFFNDDLFQNIDKDDSDHVYLYGVNKPEDKKITKLYVCTIMKFSVAEMMKSQNTFEKEIKDFKNNIRIPVGLIIKGQDIKALQPQHIKFLNIFGCPFLTVLILEDYSKINGKLCYFDDSIISQITKTPRKELSVHREELLKKTSHLNFDQSLLPKQKVKYVITKFLSRTIIKMAEEAPNAITISDNECIRQEKNIFSYKLHSKFLTTAKPDFAIYYVNGGIVNARIGFKQFDQFRKEANQVNSKVPSIFSINVAREINPIRKQFFEVLVETNGIRDPYIFINLNNLNVKKTVVALLRKQVTMQTVMNCKPIEYKNFQKDNELTFCIHVITKINSKEFQFQGKAEMIQIKKS